MSGAQQLRDVVLLPEITRSHPPRPYPRFSGKINGIAHHPDKGVFVHKIYLSRGDRLFKVYINVLERTAPAHCRQQLSGNMSRKETSEGVGQTGSKSPELGGQPFGQTFLPEMQPFLYIKGHHEVREVNG